jgi:hypothetical protein
MKCFRSVQKRFWCPWQHIPPSWTAMTWRWEALEASLLYGKIMQRAVRRSDCLALRCCMVQGPPCLRFWTCMQR